MVDESDGTSSEEIALNPASGLAPPRRRALWGVLAAVVIVTGAVVVFSAGGGAPPRLPVSLGASGHEASGMMAADSRLASVTYVAGDGLPAMGGKASAFQLEGSVDAKRVGALAGALGMRGAPELTDGTWRLTDGDAVLEVYGQSGASWWFSAHGGGVAVGSGSSSPGSVGSGSAGCPDDAECSFSGTGTAIPVPATATTIPADQCSADGSTCTTTILIAPCPPDADCPSTEPTPPVDLPTKAEARQIALDLLATTGMGVTDAKVTVDGPFDAWYISVEPRLDGIPISGQVASVSVGSKGAIENASGSMATAKRVGEYPLITTGVAIDRLNDIQGQYDGGPMPMEASDGVTRSSGAATEPAPAPDLPCAADGPDCRRLNDPAEPTTTVVSRCKPQPDGREICEPVDEPPPFDCPTTIDPGAGAGVVEPQATCAQPPICSEEHLTVEPVAGDAADTTLAPAEPAIGIACGEPYPYLPPEPIEIVLTEAERVLVLLTAFDGSGDAYLVPGYRLSNAEGVMVDVAAVEDDSLTPTTADGSISTNTTQPITPTPEPLNREPAQEPRSVAVRR